MPLPPHGNTNTTSSLGPIPPPPAGYVIGGASGSGGSGLQGGPGPGHYPNQQPYQQHGYPSLPGMSSGGGSGSGSYRPSGGSTSMGSPRSGTGRIASGGSGPASVPIEKVIDDVAVMGFSRAQVREVLQELAAEGKSVDLNVVLDRLGAR